MIKNVSRFFLFFLFLLQACAQDSSIFPEVETSLNEDEIILANPISLSFNAATSQLYVVNSNVDFYAED